MILKCGKSEDFPTRGCLKMVFFALIPHKGFFHTFLLRSCFKIVDQVQDQGGANCSTAGICVIFEDLSASGGLNDLSQHRDWALDAILKPLLIILKKGSKVRRKVISGRFGAIDKKERKFDKELEVRLESITAEIEELCRPISKLSCSVQASENGSEQKSPIPEGMLERISNAYGVGDKNAALIIYYLGTSNDRWQTIDALQKRTGLSARIIDEVATRNANPIRKGPNQSGIVVYGLRSFLFGFLTAPYYF